MSVLDGPPSKFKQHIPYTLVNIAQMNSYRNNIATLFTTIMMAWGLPCAQSQTTNINIRIPATPVQVDPMIYGQMLENVNDSMVYGGVTDLSGNPRQHLIPHLRDLQIPVMRWPGGTVVHEYHWENGIGPRDQRPTVPNLAWGGIENYQFGTDEFLQWCEQIGTVPYINFNMGNQAQFKGTLGEALTWIEYVNGSIETPYGKLRASNGRQAPYNVPYWCLGNENYLTTTGGGHIKETPAVYAAKLKQWAGAIRHYHPDLQLLGIGRSLAWNQTVLEECGHLVDFLTQHYYVTSRVRDGEIQQPLNTLFAPAKMEAHLAQLGAQLETMNEKLGRADRPIRLSIDEWNNRHSINEGDLKYKFSRQSGRRQFDVAVVGGMLNAFIRQSPHVGMANYIFPVNAHGLIRTVGNDDSYQTPIYHVFKQYREQLVGNKLDVSVEGPSISTDAVKPTIDGDSQEAAIADGSLTYIDAAAVHHQDGSIYVSLVNRSPDMELPVAIYVPAGYRGESIWTLDHQNINARNSEEQRAIIEPTVRPIKTKRGTVSTTIPACGLHIVKLLPIR